MYLLKRVMFALSTACVGMQSLAGLAEAQSSDKIDWYFAPRAWYLHTGNTVYPSTAHGVSAQKNFNWPMYGFSLGARFPSLPQTTFTFTGFLGRSSNEEGHALAYSSTALNETFVSAQFARVDMELLAQTNIPGTTSHWIFGGRYERGSDTVQSTLTSYVASAGNLVAAKSESGELEAVTQVYAVKAGYGTYAPLSADGKHRLFGNAMGVLGYVTDGVVRPYTTSNQIYRAGIDSSIGYQYLFDENWTFDARFRFLFNFNYHATNKYEYYDHNYGPILGLTRKF
jgi:hypothetical protein